MTLALTSGIMVDAMANKYDTSVIVRNCNGALAVLGFADTLNDLRYAANAVTRECRSKVKTLVSAELAAITAVIEGLDKAKQSSFSTAQDYKHWYATQKDNLIAAINAFQAAIQAITPEQLEELSATTSQAYVPVAAITFNGAPSTSKDVALAWMTDNLVNAVRNGNLQGSIRDFCVDGGIEDEDSILRVTKTTVMLMRKATEGIRLRAQRANAGEPKAPKAPKEKK